MKPELQQIAIAKVCGWWHHPDGTPIGFVHNYLNDLNAMHEAENVLNTEQAETFVSELANTVQMKRTKATINSDYFIVAHATAAQRAEAFLRCIGKWQDDAS